MTVRHEIAELRRETGAWSREGPTRTWNSTWRDWTASPPAWPPQNRARLVAAADRRLQQKCLWIMRV